MRVNNTNTVTLSQVRKMIRLYGETLTVLVQSEPGCGKSSLLTMLREDMGDAYEYIYVDCPVMDMADIGMAIPNHETQTLQYYTASLFNLSDPRPKVIMLDELLKSDKMLLKIFTRMMLERTVGNLPLPDGSIVFATSNNISDGVGDYLQAHVGNRVCCVELAKDADEWKKWAYSTGQVHPTVMAFAEQFGNALASYRDGDQDDNGMIFNPKKQQQAFVSFRSLTKSSVIIENLDEVGEAATYAALCGTIGKSAAGDMMSFIALRSELPDTQDILRDPMGTLVSSNPSVNLLVVMNTAPVIKTQDELSAAMQYIRRLQSVEIQSIFYTQAVNRPNLRPLAVHNAEINSWARDNLPIL
jgi:hypothetical protein